MSGYLLVISSEKIKDPHIGNPQGLITSIVGPWRCWFEWPTAGEGVVKNEWVCRVFFETNKKLDPQIQGIHQENPILTYFGYAGFSSNRRPQSRLDWGESLVTPPRAVSTRRRKSLDASGPTPQQKRPSSRQRRTNRAKEWRLGKSYVGYRLGSYTIKRCQFFLRKLHNKRICL